MAKKKRKKTTESMLRFGAERVGATEKAVKFRLGFDFVWVPKSCIKMRRDDDDKKVYFIMMSFARDQLSLRKGMFKNAPSSNPNRHSVAETLEDFEGDDDIDGDEEE